MIPWLSDGDLTVYVGKSESVLTSLPAESVQCVVTSPPYWNLRDYGEDGQIGRERTPREYVENLMVVFREVHRVLRPDGTLWLNLGDSYSTGGKGPSKTPKQASNTGSLIRGSTTPPPGLKRKELAGIPWRVAFALQDEGWWLRSEIIWKKNAMPESVTDRPTKTHEQIFLFAKSERYFYDAEAIREPAEWSRWGDQTNHKHEGSESAASWIKPASKAALQERGRRQNTDRGDGGGGGFYGVSYETGWRNARSVWEIPTESYTGSHFAVFPKELPRRCILAGTSERGCCPSCGSPWRRVVETDNKWKHGGQDTRGFPVEGRTGNPQSSESLHRNGGGVFSTAKTVGWEPGCEHGLTPVGCVVLDPFAGSGTTGLVARELGRRSVLIELSEEYAKLIAERVQQLSLLA